MGSQTEGPVKTFDAALALGLNLRVKRDGAGLLVLAGATDKELGTLEKPSFSAGQQVPVRLRTAEGTVKMISDGVIADDADVFTAAAGKISATQATGAFFLGTSLEAASADLDVIEIMRHAHGDTPKP